MEIVVQNPKDRNFQVVDKTTGERQLATGVSALAKLISYPEEQIPKIHLTKVTFGQYTVYEKTTPQ